LEVLTSRLLLRPVDFDRSIAFYRDTLGLAVYREFGEGGVGGVVFFIGGGLLEVSGSGPGGDRPSEALRLWFQVRDVDATHAELAAAGVAIVRPPRDEPWGLREMWIADPDGIQIAIIQIPDDHPLRRRI
jgi:catechol 2,3-dioxygenase-like lactoylglutathione lyase family enzyme